MTVQANVRLEMALDGSAFASPAFSSAFGGGGWADMQTDLRAQDPIVCEYGILSDDPSELVAGAGSLSFALNNDASNAAGIAGWYSPLNAIKRGGFDFNIPTRLIISNAAETLTVHKFTGHLADILVTPDVQADRMVRCTALDLMDDYARTPVPPIPIQFNKRGDEVIQQILDALPSSIQPGARSIETGLETYQVVGDQSEEESLTVREAIADLCASEFATAAFVGSTTPGGLFTLRNRQSAVTDPTVLHHFNFDIIKNGLVVPGSRDDLYSKIQVFVHPLREDPFPVVLWELHTSTTYVQPGETNDSIFGPYRDPDNPGDRVGGTDMIQPVATLDYTMNTIADGTGLDVTANFTVVADYSGGTGARFEITNIGGVGGYITLLRCRGKGIYRFTAMVERVIPNMPYGHQVMRVEMPYQANVNTGQDAAAYMANVYSRALSRVTSVSFFANDSSVLLAAMLIVEPGMRIAITEAMTGLDAIEFMVNGVRLEITPLANGPGIWCTWFLKPADTNRYWRLGIPGASELDLSAVLSY